MSYDKTRPSAYDKALHEAAATNGVSYELLRKLIFNESSFNPNAKSPTGPLGIAQFTAATGKAMGLKVTGGADDERLDPVKSINAAARHLGDLTRKFGGDELKAALAYNQGEGPKGQPQLDAYDRGDFASISNEGRNYMGKLTDVAKGKHRDSLMNFGGITPSAKPTTMEDLEPHYASEPKVGTELPTAPNMGIVGVKQEPPAKPFGQSFWEKHGVTVGDANSTGVFSGFGDAVGGALENTTLGAIIKTGYKEGGEAVADMLMPHQFNPYQPTEEDFNALRNSKLRPENYHEVTGSRSADGWAASIKRAEEMQDADDKRHGVNVGWGSKAFGLVAEVAGDPVTYIPFLGAAAKGSKVIYKVGSYVGRGAAGGVLSEATRTYVAGGEADYVSAAIGGGVLGGTMSSLLDKTVRKGVTKGISKSTNEWLSSTTRLDHRTKAMVEGGEDLSKFPVEHATFDKEFNGVKYAEHPVEEGAIILPDGSVMSDFNPLNPKTLEKLSEMLKQAMPDAPEKAAEGFRTKWVGMPGLDDLGLTLMSSESEAVRGIAQDLVRSTTGMASGSNGKFGATASDILERLNGKDNLTVVNLMKAVDEAIKDPMYTVGPNSMTKDAARQHMYRRVAEAIERPELQKGLTKGEHEVMDILKNHFDKKREMMENPAMFGNKKAKSIFPGSAHKGTYIPNVYDRAAKVSMIAKLGSREALGSDSRFLVNKLLLSSRSP